MECKAVAPYRAPRQWFDDSMGMQKKSQFRSSQKPSGRLKQVPWKLVALPKHEWHPCGKHTISIKDALINLQFPGLLFARDWKIFLSTRVSLYLLKLCRKSTIIYVSEILEPCDGSRTCEYMNSSAPSFRKKRCARGNRRDRKPHLGIGCNGMLNQH
mgnify:FL=1